MGGAVDPSITPSIPLSNPSTHSRDTHTHPHTPKQNILFCEVADGIHAYGVASHRHAPEIEQGLTEAAGKDVVVNFTPHLMPMSRGILESIYVKLAPGKAAADLKAELEARFEKEPFVHVLEGKKVPETRHVRGSNNCFINVFDDRVPGRAIIISAIDNLVKVKRSEAGGGKKGCLCLCMHNEVRGDTVTGATSLYHHHHHPFPPPQGASGQAVQNFNVMLGYPETTGLLSPPMFP